MTLWGLIVGGFAVLVALVVGFAVVAVALIASSRLVPVDVVAPGPFDDDPRSWLSEDSF